MGPGENVKAAKPLPKKPVKRRRYSKKSKANLRKYTDIRDVEEFLEERRFQERTG